MREYIAPRRAALLLAVLRQARGQVLDDLTLMLLKLVRKIEWKSEQQFDEWYRAGRATTDSLIRVFHESLMVHDSDDNPARKLGRSAPAPNKTRHSRRGLSASRANTA